MSLENSFRKSGDFLRRYKAELLTLLLVVWSLPDFFYREPGAALDGSWAQALNIAFHEKWSFGRDIVFTYGPLGYLSTRNVLYVSKLSLFLCDLFVLVSLLYVFLRMLRKDVWWFLLLAASVVFFRDAERSVAMFTLFAIYLMLNLRNDFVNRFEVVVLAVSGVLPFFIKLNYGLITYPMLAAAMVFLAVRRRYRPLLWLAGVSSLLFVLLLSVVHVSIAAYVRGSLELIRGYNEAMQLYIDPASPPMVAAKRYVLLVIVLLLCIIYNARVNKRYLSMALSSVIVGVVFFLAFKNGFTRNPHYVFFFRHLPLFFVVTAYVLEIERMVLVRAICIAALVLSDDNLDIMPEGQRTGLLSYNYYSFCKGYWSTFLKSPPGHMNSALKLSDSVKRGIGDATVDIMPIDISVLLENRMNYKPRPVIQSYSAYTPYLDSLNAAHFASDRRPEYILASLSAIDDRMPMWDESTTKMTLHLNYEYKYPVSLTHQPGISDSDWSYLLLRRKDRPATVPALTYLSDTTVRFGTAVPLHFASDEAIYMKLDMAYTGKGLIKSLFYYPTILYATLFFDDAFSTSIEKRMGRPIVTGPVLVNKAVLHNDAYADFIAGRITRVKDVRGIRFRAMREDEVKPDIKLTFYRMTNYHKIAPAALPELVTSDSVTTNAAQR